MGCQFLFFLFIWPLIDAGSRSDADEDNKAREFYLRQNHNNLVLPIQSNGSVVIVKTRLKLNKVISVDTAEQVARFSVTLQFFWLDERAAWNDSVSESTSILMLSKHIWTPKLTLTSCTNPRYCGSGNDAQSNIVRVSKQVSHDHLEIKEFIIQRRVMVYVHVCMKASGSSWRLGVQKNLSD